MAKPEVIRAIASLTVVVIALLSFPYAIEAVGNHQQSNHEEVRSELAGSASNPMRLKYTRYGWQAVDYWIVRTPTEIGLDRVHPVVWGALMLFGVLALVIWSADEVEVSEIFGEQTNCK